MLSVLKGKTHLVENEEVSIEAVEVIKWLTPEMREEKEGVEGEEGEVD